MAASNQSGLAVVCAIENGLGIRNFKRDDGNRRSAEARGDLAGNARVRLRFDDQVEALAHEDIGVMQRHAGTILVVEHEKVDVRSGGAALQALGHSPAEAELGALHSITEAIPFLSERADAKPVLGSSHAGEQFAGDECGEHTQRSCLVQSGARHHIRETEAFGLVAEDFQDMAGSDQGLHNQRSS